MGSRKRDHKAEYAAAKKRATAAGYSSQREYRAVRKELNLPAKASPISRPVMERIEPGVTAKAKSSSKLIGRLRKESKAWSDKHSHSHRSRYNPRMSDEQVRKYHRAYVESLAGSRKAVAKAKLQRIQEYLVPDFLNVSEWESKYSMAN